MVVQQDSIKYDKEDLFLIQPRSSKFKKLTMHARLQDVQDNSADKFKYCLYEHKAAYQKIFSFNEVRCIHVGLSAFMV